MTDEVIIIRSLNCACGLDEGRTGGDRGEVLVIARMPSGLIQEAKFTGCLLECWFADRDLQHRVRYVVTSGDVLGVFTACDCNAIDN